MDGCGVALKQKGCRLWEMKCAAAILLPGILLLTSMKAAPPDPLPDQVTVCLLGPEGRPLPAARTPSVRKSDDEWLRQLGPEAYRVVRAQVTDRPFCGNLLDNKKTGIYFCVACNLPLFSSDAKFDSGTGWPSFFQPFARENVTEFADESHGMRRVEVRCTRCGGHLGHVFPDGPPPTRLRYCLNSESLTFRETRPAEGKSE